MMTSVLHIFSRQKKVFFFYWKKNIKCHFAKSYNLGYGLTTTY